MKDDATGDRLVPVTVLRSTATMSLRLAFLRIVAAGAWFSAIVLVGCGGDRFEGSASDGGSDSPGTNTADGGTDDAGALEAAAGQDAMQDGPAGDGPAPDAPSQCVDGGLLGDQVEESATDNVGVCAEAYLFHASTMSCPTSFELFLPSGDSGTAISLGLYADDGTCTHPAALLAQGTWSATTSAAAGWTHVPFTNGGDVTLLAGTCYWIAVASLMPVEVLDRAGASSSSLSCAQTTACLGLVPSPSWGGGCASTFGQEGPLSAYVH